MNWTSAKQRDATLKVIRLWVHINGDASVLGPGRGIPVGASGRLYDVLCGPPYREMARILYHRAVRDPETLDAETRIKTLAARDRVREA